MIHNLREVLSRALGTAGLEATSDIWLLSEHWSAALGAQIASRATPVRLVRGELVIAVREAVWRQELALLAPRIVERLNQAIGREVVQRVRLVGGDVPAAEVLTSERPRRRLPRVSSAGAPGAAAPQAKAGEREAGGEIAAALRSLAAKRAERVVADGAAASPPKPRGGKARPRGGW